MAFGTITSQGVGSSLDVAGIVSRLMEVERVPLARLDQKKASFDARISALGAIKGSLSTLQSSLSALRSGAAFRASTAVSSNPTLVRASGASGALAGDYAIQVSQLAQSQKLAAAGLADATAPIGNGTITIELGTIAGGSFDAATGTYSGASFTANGSGSHEVVIDGANNSLQGIRDAINAADIGVRAAIVNDGDPVNPYRLVLSAQAGGASNSIRIAVAGDATLSDLLAHDPSGTQRLSETVTAQNALFSVDGITVTRASNSVEDAIQGVTLSLVGQTAGNPVTITVAQDSSRIKGAIEAFVKGYNDLYGLIRAQTASGVSGGKAGALSGDALARQIESVIRAELNTPVSGVSGAYSTLSSIGVGFQADGSLALDQASLEAALQSDPANVAGLFSSADGYASRIGDVVADLLSTSGMIASRTEGYQRQARGIEDQRLSLEARLARTEQRLRAQFTTLDVLVGRMSVTSNYLAQQLEGLRANVN